MLRRLDFAEIDEILRSRRLPPTPSPSSEIVSEYQRAALAASSVPGTREGNSVESSVATEAATVASNTGSS